MKKIGIITSTRAEFGLLLPIIQSLRKNENKNLIVEVIVTGTHLFYEYGHTIEEIIKNDIRIDEIITIPIESKSPSDISHNQSVTIEKFTTLFIKKNYNGVLILGDRYEMLAISIAAGNTLTPIFHIGGGDTTEGAVDEWIRHAITKMSYLHFTTNEESYNRVIQLGEYPDRVFNFGSTSIDNILKLPYMSKEEGLESIGLKECNYAICTYHPVTMENGSVDEMIWNFIKALSNTPEMEFIVTKSNADQGGARINELLDIAQEEVQNLHVYSSLGVVRYLSLMKSAEFVLGNSSSGIIEAPVFGIPTINIGDRQRGRLQSKSVINCNADVESIQHAISQAMDLEFKKICKQAISPYGNGNAAEQIAKTIFDVVSNGTIDLKKKFYDIEVRM